MQSPVIVASAQRVIDTSDKLQSVNHFVSDSYCASVSLQHSQWLQALEQEPQDLLAHISKRNSPRLGYYFEDLVAYWLQQKISLQYFESHLKVKQAGRDIGEFDFLFRTDGTVEHWETAVKFYLYTEDKTGGVTWYGPNARDTLHAKLERLFTHQVLLGQHPAADELLAERGIKQLASRVFLKGYLFYPLGRRASSAPQSVAGCEISRHHLKGWWVPVDSINAIEKVIESAPSMRWQILPRLEWMAPRVYTSVLNPRPLLATQEICEMLVSHFSGSDQAQLIAGYVINDVGEWQEQTRGFVVGPNWPN